MKVLLKKELRLVTVAAVIAAVNLLFYLFMAYPQRYQAENREKEYLSLRHKLADLRADVTLAKRVEEGKATMAGLKGRLPAKDDLPAMIREIHGLARKYNLKIPTVKYEPKREKGEAMMRLLITLPVVGEYPDIRRFIHEMETSDRLVMLENMGIATSGGTGKAGNERGAQLQLTMSTYIRPEAMTESAPAPMKPEKGSQR